MQQRKEHKETKTTDIAERKRQRSNRGSTQAKKAALNHRQAKEAVLNQRQKKEAVNTMEAAKKQMKAEEKHYLSNRGRATGAAEAEAEAKPLSQQ